MDRILDLGSCSAYVGRALLMRVPPMRILLEPSRRTGRVSCVRRMRCVGACGAVSCSDRNSPDHDYADGTGLETETGMARKIFIECSRQCSAALSWRDGSTVPLPLPLPLPPASVWPQARCEVSESRVLLTFDLDASKDPPSHPAPTNQPSSANPPQPSPPHRSPHLSSHNATTTTTTANPPNPHTPRRRIQLHHKAPQCATRADDLARLHPRRWVQRRPPHALREGIQWVERRRRGRARRARLRLGLSLRMRTRCLRSWFGHWTM
ncbi:hypothetical protein IWX90DRAFT_301986 [Phyllosticta citrichinensis]|uniref:Uncharacterized protein n=1 Tax=Phyllosticta citrichinensis TaxID=1130410 RepID=A0ABR1XKZ0_9PEZI